MLDTRIRRGIDPVLNLVVKPLTGLVSPNQITLAGFVIGLLAVPFLFFELYYWALGCIAINRIFDGLDGALARQTLTSDFGGFLDIVCDFIFYTAIAAGFGLAQPQYAWVSLLLITSFAGTSSSFMAYAVMAEKRKISEASKQKKALHYLGGLTEGTETIIFFVLCCLFPQVFWLLGLIFAALCLLTTISRFKQAYEDLR